MMLKTAVQPQFYSNYIKGRKYAHDDVTYHIKSATTIVDDKNIDAPNNKTRVSYIYKNLTIHSYKDMKRNYHRTRRDELTTL